MGRVFFDVYNAAVNSLYILFKDGVHEKSKLVNTANDPQTFIQLLIFLFSILSSEPGLPDCGPGLPDRGPRVNISWSQITEIVGQEYPLLTPQ